MKVHPYHSADGRLWPELDERVVPLLTLAAYEGISHPTAYKRWIAGYYGKNAQASGIWADNRPGRRPIIKARPAVIWRLRGFGRYAALASFDPRTVRESLYCCSPADTAARLPSGAQQPMQPSLRDMLRAFTVEFARAHGVTADEIAAALRGSDAPTNVLPFPALQR